MLRRLLTLFALISGLAAVGTPAAAMDEARGFGVEQAAGRESAPRDAAMPCTSPARERRAAADRGPCRPVVRIRIVIPTVMLGSDRAAE